jgi:hypothetical protein
MSQFKTDRYRQTIRNARLEIALEMCNTHKGLLEQTLSNEQPEMFEPYDTDRAFQIQILREILKLEPTILNILKLYADN